MSFAERWLRRPQNTWIYKALFQIHLWGGIALGLYVAVVCASGSAIVFRNDMYDLFDVWNKAGPTDLQKHLIKAGYAFTRWSGDLHGSLLLGISGVKVNAIGGFVLSAVCVAGLIVWWPGIATWKRGLTIRLDVGWKRLVFDLHKAVGFWMFGLLFMWGMTAGYFVYPETFRATINYFTPINPPALPGPPPQQRAVVMSASEFAAASKAPPKPRVRRPPRPLTRGGKILKGFSYAHYGNFAGWGVKLLWVVLGLVPLVLVVTSLLMWWNRALNPALLRWRRRLDSRQATGAGVTALVSFPQAVEQPDAGIPPEVAL